MKTHVVEIRLIQPTPGKWERLTREPITRRDADNLSQMIGPAWESRVVSLSSPMGTQFAELERRFGKSIERWMPITLAHHPACVGHGHVGGVEAWESSPLDVTGDALVTGCEWLNLQRVRQIVGELHRDRESIDAQAVAIDEHPTIHKGRCRECGATARALSITVRITTTFTSSREYAL